MANKTIDEIKAEAAVVRDATEEKENTALRVGTVLIDMIDTLSESVSINAIKGYVVIDSTSELPENPTPEQQQKGYLLDTTLYVYVGEGGDTLDGKYQSAELKGADGQDGAPGPQGPKGDSGVDLGEVVLVNDLTTGGEGSALSAEMGKELGDMLIEHTENLLSGTITTYAKINNNGSIVTGNAGYGSVTTIDVSSVDVPIRIYGNCTGYAKSAFAFYDANNTLVQKGNSFNGDGNIDIDVNVEKPSTATKLVLSQNRDTTSMYAAELIETDKIEDLYTSVEELSDDVDEMQTAIFSSTNRGLYGNDLIPNSKIDASGNIIYREGYGFITQMPIPSGIKKVHIYGNSGVYNKTLYAFYQGSTLIEKGDSYAGDFNVDIDKVVDVPENADNIKLSQNVGSRGSLFAEFVIDTTAAESVDYNVNDLTNFGSLNYAELMALHSAAQARAEGRMIFEDDFNEYKLNDNIWNIDEGQFLNRTTYVNAKENVWVENSILHISASRRNQYGKVSMGQVTTKGKYDFAGSVRIEGKFKMPTIGCFWPAFWTWGTDTYAVSQGAGAYVELDIFELFGSTQDSTNGRISSNLWTGDAVGDGSTSGLTQGGGNLLTNDGKWHIYTADIYQDKVIISLDGTPLCKCALTDEKRQYIYTMRQYVMMSVQYWDRNSATEELDGATLECDWVHVYALDDTAMMPSAITVDSTLSMSVGDKVRLIPSLGNCHDQTTTYDIVNENIVGHGDIVHSELVAKAVGTTDVYVITKNRKTAKCTVTVS